MQIFIAIDEFMDIWVYVILKARLARFFTTVALLRDYSNPRIRLSESGYYMASFELAGEYIRTLSADFPSRNARVPALSSAPDEVFFVAEVSLFHQFLESFRDALRVIQDEYCLEGFRLVVDFDQQLESGRFVLILCTIRYLNFQALQWLSLQLPNFLYWLILLS